jgi:hypothetical protein
MHSRQQWLVWLLCAVVVSVLLHSDAIIRHMHSSPEKVGVLLSGPRTDVGDNYYYFSMLKHAPERIFSGAVRQADPDGGDHRNVNAVTDSYAAALYAGHILYRVAAVLTTTSRGAVLLTSILHTAVLAFCFVALLATLLGGDFRQKRFLLLMLVYVGMVFVDSFGNSAYFGRYYWANNLLTYYSNPTRLVNPTLFWAAGLAAAAFIVRWIREERLRDCIAAVALAGLAGLFSISVGATLVLALGLSIVFEALRARRICWHLLGVMAATTAGLAWNYLQLRAYGATALGQDLRHGEFLGLVTKWHFLLLLGLIPLVWRMLGTERAFVAALVVAVTIIGMFCESFHLGSRLWVRGAVIYAWAVTVFVAARFALGWFESRSGAIKGRAWWKVLAMTLLAVFVIQAQRPDADAWKGFIERDKWELFEWMDAHLPDSSVVASADIEDAFLLPIYTRAKPLYSMYGVTNRTRDDELRRYFFNMRLYGRDRQLLSAALSVKQEDILEYLKHVMGEVRSPYRGAAADAIIFLELVVYHSYVRGLSHVFTDPEQHQLLETLLRSRADESSRLNYATDYAIVQSGHSIPPSFAGWLTIYENSQYSVLKNPFTQGKT